MEVAAPIPLRIPLRWKSAAVVGLLIGMVWACVLTVGNRVEPRFYVHSDGHVSMGGKEAPEINLEEISKRFESQRMWPRCIVIEAVSNLPFEDLETLLFELSGLGFGSYELRVNGTSLNFSLPGDYGCFGEIGGNPNPEIIDLRVDRMLDPLPEHLVLAHESGRKAG